MYANEEHEIDWKLHKCGEQMDANWKLLEAEAREARDMGVLLGRYVTHPIADGNAIYQVVSESVRTVRIKVCYGLGDDWTIPAWGVGCRVSKATILDMVARRDRLAVMFGHRP